MYFPINMKPPSVPRRGTPLFRKGILTEASRLSLTRWFSSDNNPGSKSIALLRVQMFYITALHGYIHTFQIHLLRETRFFVEQHTIYCISRDWEIYIHIKLKFIYHGGRINTLIRYLFNSWRVENSPRICQAGSLYLFFFFFFRYFKWYETTY